MPSRVWSRFGSRGPPCSRTSTICGASRSQWQSRWPRRRERKGSPELNSATLFSRLRTQCGNRNTGEFRRPEMGFAAILFLLLTQTEQQDFQISVKVDLVVVHTTV